MEASSSCMGRKLSSGGTSLCAAAAWGGSREGSMLRERPAVGQANPAKWYCESEAWQPADVCTCQGTGSSARGMCAEGLEGFEAQEQAGCHGRSQAGVSLAFVASPTAASLSPVLQLCPCGPPGICSTRSPPCTHATAPETPCYPQPPTVPVLLASVLHRWRCCST